MLFSSSSYPKIIYGMPLDELGVQIKFELKQKRNGKRKREKKKREGPDHHELALGEEAQLLLAGPSGQSPPGELRIRKKKKWVVPTEQAHGHLLLLGPGRQKPAPNSEFRDTDELQRAPLNPTSTATSCEHSVVLRPPPGELR